MYKIGELNVPIAFNMFLMEHFWKEFATDMTGSDVLAILIYYGNKAHCKVEGGFPAFQNIQEVYKLLMSHKDAGVLDQIANDFKESQGYKDDIEKLKTITAELEGKKK
jgi:hypothetical protein